MQCHLPDYLLGSSDTDMYKWADDTRRLIVCTALGSALETAVTPGDI